MTGTCARREGNTIHMQQSQSNVYRRRTTRTRKKKMRRQRMTGAVVLASLVVVMLVLALLFSDKSQAAGAVTGLPDSLAVSAPASNVNPTPVPSILPAATGEFDVAGIPPLFNATHLIPDDYEMNLVDVGNGHTMDAPAAAAFLAMKEAAAADGVTLLPISGYRSHEHQLTNYNNSIQNYMSQGYSEEEATRLTRRYYAIPGTSEHEAGLAMDIGSLEETFENTPAFDWLQEHAVEYGFILRYRDGQEEVTGVAYEPWHYRYVGVNHAQKIAELGVQSLEEYVGLLNGDAGVTDTGASTGDAVIGIG